jgi:ABC-type sulfate/molybdate transport systems ATPase subunit
MAALYILEEVTFRRAGGFTLAIPALRIEEGGIHALSGPNGAGKSTLLALLAFLEAPDTGTIRFGGEAVGRGRRALESGRRQATLLHQLPYLFDDSVAANVGFGPSVRGFSGDGLRRRVDASLEAVGLSGFGPRPARGLSGGEAQRVALARALAVEPRALLLDEPFSNVDRETADTIERIVRTLPARGTTVVLATHDPALPSRIGAEAIRLADGTLSKGDAPHAVA